MQEQECDGVERIHSHQKSFGGDSTTAVLSDTDRRVSGQRTHNVRSVKRGDDGYDEVG